MGRLIETTQDEKTLSYYKYYETGLPEIPAERLALAAAPQPVGRGIPFDEKDDFILFPADKDYCYVGYGENENGSCYAANQTFVPGGGSPATVCHKVRIVEGGMMIDSYFWVGYIIDEQGKPGRLDPKTSPIPLLAAARALYTHNLREMGKMAEVLVPLYAEEGDRI